MRLHVLDMDDMRTRVQRPPRLRPSLLKSLEHLTLNENNFTILEDDLLVWLRCTARFESSRPHDKLFALLGLTRSPLWREVKVDYSRQVTHVMKELVAHQANAHRSLAILTLCHPNRSMEEGSWIPDLAVEGLSELPPLDRGILDMSDPFQECIRAHSKEKGGLAAATCYVKGTRLYAQGITLGRVNYVPRGIAAVRETIGLPKNTVEMDPALSHSLQKNKQIDLDDPEQVPSELHDLFALLRTEASSHQWPPTSLKETLHNELLALTALQQEPSKTTPRLASYQNLRQTGTQNALIHFHWRPLWSQLIPQPQQSSHRTTQDEFLRLRSATQQITISPQEGTSLTRATTGRIQFTTDTGLLGLGPWDLQENDRVVLFRNSPFAFAVRDEGQKSVLVGPVFVAPPREVEVERDFGKRPTEWPMSWREPVEESFVLE